MSGLTKNLILAVAIAAVLWIGYLSFFSPDEDDLLSADALVINEAVIEAQRFLGDINKLDKVSFENSLLTDERFESLVDFRNEIADEPTGRTNPFDPIDPIE